MSLKRTLLKGLRNILSNKAPKTERLLSLFLLTVISLMTLAMITVISDSLKHDLENYYSETNEKSAQTTIKQIERYLLVREIQLDDQATNPALIQIIENNRNDEAFNQFFADQKIIGSHYPQAIYDASGKRSYISASINPENATFLKEFNAIPESLFDLIKLN